MGVLLIGGALCALFLPETFNKHLPQTLEDGETFTSSRICTSRRVLLLLLLLLFLIYITKNKTIYIQGQEYFRRKKYEFFVNDA